MLRRFVEGAHLSYQFKSLGDALELAFYFIPSLAQVVQFVLEGRFPLAELKRFCVFHMAYITYNRVPAQAQSL